MQAPTGQGQKKQSTLTSKNKKRKKKTVPFLKSMVRQGTPPLMEGIEMALASILLELRDVPNLQILSNTKTTGLKPITSTAMIPSKWEKFNRYVMCYNEVNNTTRKITGIKSRVLKIVVTIGSDIGIVDILAENVINMAQISLLMEVKCLKVTHSKKGLLLAMLPKNTNLSYV